MASGIPIEQLMIYLLILVPPALVWIVIIYFCLTRHRQNPTGATYLGLAILFQILVYALSLLTVLLPQEWIMRLFSMEWAGYIQQGVYGLLQAIVWIMIGMAVFSRRADQYTDLS